MINLKTKDELNEIENAVFENYGEVLSELETAFRKAEAGMKGSSISPLEIWADLGERLGYVTEKQADKIKNGTV